MRSVTPVVCASLVALLGAIAEETKNISIESLQERITQLEADNREIRSELDSLDYDISPGEGQGTAAELRFGNILLSGYGAVAFFDQGSEGAFPNSEFKLDDSRLIVDAKILEGAYFYTSITLAQREVEDLNLEVFEMFLELDNISGHWGADGLLSLRLGRTYIPFGEEYLHREPLDNSLISHSYSDIWGVDEGILGFGRMGIVDYVVAVQNGGYQSLDDKNSDKSVTLKIGVEPSDRLRISASAMRTGTLDAQDRCAAIWFGNHFISPPNLPEPAQDFEAELAELDLRITWDGGHFAAAGGWFGFEGEGRPLTGDTGEKMPNPERADSDILYYYVEGAQTIVRDLYGAVRFSQVDADDGYLLFGQSDPAFGLSRFTTEAWRLSLGLGYRFAKNLVAKIEYSLERGKLDDGRDLEDQDLFGLQLAFGF
jgi:hypothetical protein